MHVCIHEVINKTLIKDSVDSSNDDHTLVIASQVSRLI